MFRLLILIFFFLNSHFIFAQSEIKIVDNFGYSSDKITEVISNLEIGCECIERAFEHISGIANEGLSKWNSEEEIIIWLGKATSALHMKNAEKRLKKMNKVCKRKIKIVLNKEKKGGLCKGSRHAWAIPKGKVVLHLCPQFTYKSNKYQSKILIHEIAHESGILFHKKVFWRSAALDMAKNNSKLALKNPENFAFYIMSYYSEAEN